MSGPVSSTPGPVRPNAHSAAARRYVLVGIAMPLSAYLLYGVLGLTTSGQARDAGWAGHFMASMAALGAMSAALAAAGVQRRPAAGGGSWRGARSTLAGWLSRALVLAAPPIVAVSIAGALLNDVTLAAASWLDLFASLWLGAIPFLVLGLLLSRLVHPDTAAIVVVGVTVALGVLGGLFQPVASLPPLMAAIAGGLPSYHLASLGWSAAAGQGPMPVDIAVLAAYTVILLAALRWTGGIERRRADG